MARPGRLHRLFLALPLVSTAPAQLQANCAVLGRFAALRLVPSCNYHLTLHFFGEVSREREPQIQQALSAAGEELPAAELALELVSLQPLPTRGATNLVYTALGGDLGPMRSLTLAVHRRVISCGFEAESRTPLAHVTVARSQRGHRWQLSPALQSLWQNSVATRAQRLVLFSSSLGRGGAVYEEEASVSISEHRAVGSR